MSQSKKYTIKKMHEVTMPCVKSSFVCLVQSCTSHFPQIIKVSWQGCYIYRQGWFVVLWALMYCTIIPLLFSIKSITTWLKLHGDTWPVLAGMSCSLWTSNLPADISAVTCCSKQWVGDRSAQSYVSWVLCRGITVPVSPVACLWADPTYGLVKCAFWCCGLLPNWLTCPSSLYMMWQTEKLTD